MFEVIADRRLGMLRIVMRGFWDEKIMAAYTKAVRQEMAELQRTSGCRYILINMIEFAIQSKEIAEGHAENLRMVKKLGGIRVALVMQSALSKLQAARVASDTGHATFDTETTALAWLLDERNDSQEQ